MRTDRAAVAVICALALALGAARGVAQEDAAPAAGSSRELEPALVLEGHDADIYDVAFAPDGRTLATASFDRTVRVWDASSGELRIFLAGHDGKVLALDYSPDARLLASGSEDLSVKIWDVPGEPTRDFAGRSARVGALAMSPDLEWLASADVAGSVLVHQRSDQSVKARLRTGEATARALGFAPGKGRLAATAGDTLYLWDLSEVLRAALEENARANTSLIGPAAEWRYLEGRAEPPPEWKEPEHDVATWRRGPGGFGYSSSDAELETVATRLDGMADGSFVSLYLRTEFGVDAPDEVRHLTLSVVLDDGFVAYLNGAEVARHNIEGEPPAFDAVTPRTLEPDALTFSLDAHRGLLRPGRNVLALQAHNTSRSSSDFVITAELRASLERRPREDASVEPKTFTLDASVGELIGLAWSPDAASLVTGSKTGALLVWSADGEVQRRMEHSWPAHDLAFIASDLVAVTGGGNSITLWRTSDGSAAGQLHGHVAPVRALDVSASGNRLVSASTDGRIVLWDTETRTALVEVSGHDRGVRDVALSPDGEQFVSTGDDDGEVKIWAASGERTRVHAAPGPVACVVAGNRDRVYAAGWGPAIREWRTPASTALKTLAGHEGAVHAVAFAPSGRMLASGSADATIRLWRVVDGVPIRALPAHSGPVYALTFHPDGHLLASGGFDREVKLWDPAGGRAVRTLDGHGEGVFALVFSRTGEQLYSASSDRTVRRFNVAHGTLERAFEGHPDWVSGLVLSPDGAALTSIDYGGHLFRWDTETGAIVEQRRHYGVVYALAIAPDGKRLATANMGRKALVFDVE